MFEYLERYPTCFDVGGFRRRRTDGNELQVGGHLGKHRDPAVAGWAKRWNLWGGHGALNNRLVGKETYLPFVHCAEVAYESQVVGFWRGRAITETIFPINRILNTLWCRHSSMTFSSLIVMSIGSAIAI